MLLLPLAGCDRGGGVVRRGNLSYDASEVFGEQTVALELAMAAGRGDTEEISRLVDGGVAVDSVGQHEITPLWWTAWARNYRGFQALLENGADPNHQRQQGLPVMHLTVMNKDIRFLETALKHGGDPNLIDLKSGFALLFEAIRLGDREHSRLLLDTDVDPNARMPVSGWTLPMSAVATTADYEMVYRLIKKGADPAVTNVHGSTIADTIAVTSVHASNNDDPWRAKVMAILKEKGIKPTEKTMLRIKKSP